MTDRVRLGAVGALREVARDVGRRERQHAAADVAEVARQTGGDNSQAGGLPDDIQQKQAQRYGEMFSLFHKHADKIDRVTLWGVTDGDSWLNRPGRANHPLLFDRNGKPKPAFDAVIKAASSQTTPVLP